MSHDTDLRELANLSPERPERYDVTITVKPSGSGSHGAELTVDLTDIARADIMAPDYANPGVRSIVQYLERSLGWADGEVKA